MAKPYTNDLLTIREIEKRLGLRRGEAEDLIFRGILRLHRRGRSRFVEHQSVGRGLVNAVNEHQEQAEFLARLLEAWSASR